MATDSPTSMSYARYTTPIPPEPSTSWMSYRPAKRDPTASSPFRPAVFASVGGSMPWASSWRPRYATSRSFSRSSSTIWPNAPASSPISSPPPTSMPPVYCPSLTLRVGSANTTVNRVTFNVTGANIAPNPTAVIGTPGNGAPVTSPAGGVEIEIATRTPGSGFKTYTMSLTANSSSGLVCVAGTGCGTTIIPFNTVSWTSYNLDTGNGAGQDIQNGTFDGTASQLLVNYQNTVVLYVIGNSVTMRNVLIYSYDNAQLYPAGQYLGTVTYTATYL